MLPAFFRFGILAALEHHDQPIVSKFDIAHTVTIRANIESANFGEPGRCRPPQTQDCPVADTPQCFRLALDDFFQTVQQNWFPPVRGELYPKVGDGMR